MRKPEPDNAIKIPSWHQAMDRAADTRLTTLGDGQQADKIYSASEVTTAYRYWIAGFLCARDIMRALLPEEGESAWDYMDRLDAAITREEAPVSVPAEERCLWVQGKEMLSGAAWKELRRLSNEKGVPVAAL